MAWSYDGPLHIHTYKCRRQSKRKNQDFARVTATCLTQALSSSCHQRAPSITILCFLASAVIPLCGIFRRLDLTSNLINCVPWECRTLLCLNALNVWVPGEFKCLQSALVWKWEIRGECLARRREAQRGKRCLLCRVEIPEAVLEGPWLETFHFGNNSRSMHSFLAFLPLLVPR